MGLKVRGRTLRLGVRLSCGRPTHWGTPLQSPRPRSDSWVG